MPDTTYALSCSAIFDSLAKERLAQIWDSRAILSRGTGFNFYKYAAPKIAFAFFRGRGLPGFLKRA